MQVGVSLVTLTLVLVIAAVLLYTVDSTGQALAVSVGGWPIPFGIVLYVDRLAALLVVASVALPFSLTHAQDVDVSTVEVPPPPSSPRPCPWPASSSTR